MDHRAIAIPIFGLVLDAGLHEGVGTRKRNKSEYWKKHIACSQKYIVIGIGKDNEISRLADN